MSAPCSGACNPVPIRDGVQVTRRPIAGAGLAGAAVRDVISSPFAQNNNPAILGRQQQEQW